MRRNTTQRYAVLDYLRSTTSHPSAEEVYSAVRKKLPRISLATVYRNLDVLCQSGAATMIEYDDIRRYDGNPEPHAHIKCRECARISDITVPLSLCRAKDIHHQTGYVVTHMDVCYYGICPSCHKQETVQ